MVNCVLWLAARRLLVRLWAWEEQMRTGQTSASLLRHRNNISARWDLEREAETPNTSVTAKWNGHIFLRLWGEVTRRRQSVISQWCPVLFCREKNFPFLSYLIGADTPFSFNFSWNSALLGANAYMKGKQSMRTVGKDDTVSPIGFLLFNTPSAPASTFFLQTTNKCPQVKKHHRHIDHRTLQHRAVFQIWIFFRFH